MIEGWRAGCDRFPRTQPLLFSQLHASAQLLVFCPTNPHATRQE